MRCFQPMHCAFAHQARAGRCNMGTRYSLSLGTRLASLGSAPSKLCSCGPAAVAIDVQIMLAPLSGPPHVHLAAMRTHAQEGRGRGPQRTRCCRPHAGNLRQDLLLERHGQLLLPPTAAAQPSLQLVAG